MTTILRTTILQRFPVLLLLLGSCAGGGPTQSGLTPAPNRLSAVAGDGQTWTVGASLPATLDVRVFDRAHQPVAGAAVTWRTSNGTVSPVDPKTNAEGMASARWTLGTAAGRQFAYAEVGDLSIRFEAVARAASPAAIRVEGGAGQFSAPEAELVQSLAAVIVDTYGNPVDGVSVTWEVVSGGGTLTAISPATAGGGRATAVWRLGSSLGRQSARVRMEGADATFEADAVTPHMAIEDGAEQSGLASQVLANRLTVRLTDGTDRPLAGVEVSWVAVEGGGSFQLEEGLSRTDAAGRARGRWVLGRDVGVQAAEARTTGGAPIRFQARAVPAASLDLQVPAGYLLHEGATNYATLLRPIGEMRGLMLLVDFEDGPANETVEEIRDNYVPPMEAYLDEASRGRLRLRVDVYPRWIRAPRRLEEYGVTGPGATPRTFDLLTEVIRRIDAEVDFAPYSIVYLVVPWNNPYTGNSPNAGHAIITQQGFGIGTAERELRHLAYAGNSSYRPYMTLVHETLHLFGLPDLYNGRIPSFSANRMDFAGYWDPMSASSFLRIFPGPGGTWNDRTMESGLMAWHLWKLGWIDADDILSLEVGGLEVDLSPLAAGSGPKAIAFRTGPSTALVMEYRASRGQDAWVCFPGLLVYEVDARIGTASGPIRIVPAIADPGNTGNCGPHERAAFASHSREILRHSASGAEATVISAGEVLRARAIRSPTAAAGALAPAGASGEILDGPGRTLVY